jgi:very-short-patch-repair endonuclease
MAKIKDLTGNTYGKLTVLKFHHRDKYTYFACSCSCTNPKIIIVLGGNLTSGGSTSCGICERFELPGRTFGKLTVLKFDHVRKYMGTSHNYFLCSCSGSSKHHTVVVTGNNLLRGHTSQCDSCAAKLRTRIGKNEHQILNLKARELKIKIERQVSFLSYVVDGYCRKTNTIFEVYEKCHDYTITRDLKRQQELTAHLHCNFIIIHDRTH